ncbi:AAA family ATPase [Micromonospora sp. LOL_014]|uniref:AAA family ATPase n=1 Tax=Micromonospora sp. LOL_014 TaxID=3345415 RepID=UPI003A8565F5
MSIGNTNVRLHLLGPVRVERDGTDLPLGSARRAAVLCVLALRTGHRVSRDQLVAALWGEDAPASAIGNIYTYVSALRHMLEPDRGRWAGGQILSSGSGTYQLHLPPEAVDVIRFESLRDAARRYRADGNTVAELAAVESALDLWHGDALTGVPGPFAEAQRVRLAELRFATTERYAALLVGQGRREEAAAVLRRLVEAYPDRAHLRVMLADVRQTSSHGPGQGLDAGAPAGSRPVAGTADGTATTARSGGAAFVGRDAELCNLRRATAEAALGRGRSVLVSGAPGLGKSALLATAMSAAAPGHYRVGWAVGDEVTQSSPLGTLAECLESALGEDSARRLIDRFPASADQVPAQAVADVVDLVCRAARATPLGLVLDDLHWADPATLRVWAELSGRVAELPLLLVATVRPGASDRTVPSVDEVVRLTPLDVTAATAVVRASAPQPPEAEQLAWILAEAGGHPGYLRQLAAGTAATSSSVALSAMIEAHLAPFTEETLRSLRAIAFLSAYELRAPGTQPAGATPAELGAVTGRTPDDLDRALAPALADEVLAVEGDRLVFRHRIVARTLHEATPVALRITLHRSYAERLVAARAPVEQVVAQLLVGEVPLVGRAGAWLVENVEALVDRAPATAIAVLRQAHAQHALDPAQRLRLTAWLARMLLRQQQVATAEAGWVAARTSDPDLRGEMHWVAAHTHERRGEFESAAEIAHTALRERRITPEWMHRLRVLLARVRPHLPGQATEPHLPRSTALDGGDSPS